MLVVTAAADDDRRIGADAARAWGDGAALFQRLLQICLQLPPRFHRWYGDQVALALYQREFPQQFAALAVHEYLHIAAEALDAARLRTLLAQHVRMVTFKGPSAKAFLAPTLAQLQTLLGPLGHTADD